MDVYFAPLAVSDLAEIRDDIAESNVAAAEQLLDAIEEACHRFGHFPQIGRFRDDLLPGIRVFAVKKNDTVFYRILKDAVEIVRVMPIDSTVTTRADITT